MACVTGSNFCPYTTMSSDSSNFLVAEAQLVLDLASISENYSDIY